MTTHPIPTAYMLDRLAEARAIVTGLDQYTPSQRELAWRVLSGMPAHLRAPRAEARADEAEGGA